jgi:hypothetical protein
MAQSLNNSKTEIISWEHNKLYVFLQIFATICLSVSDDWQHVTWLPGTMIGGLQRKPHSMVNAKITIYTGSDR